MNEMNAFHATKLGMYTLNTYYSCVYILTTHRR